MSKQLLIAAAAFPLVLSVPLTAGEAGKMKREIWTNIPGATVDDLTGSDRFYSAADIVGTIDGSEAPANWGENYGQRLRGYIIAPESGDYKFWIAGDDHCELHLSSDQSKFNAGKIAWAGGHTAPGQWDKYPSQESAVVSLIAGRKYFIQALHKERGGGDHLAIAWRHPSGEREPIPASALESFIVDPDDADDDGLKDSFESAHNLDPGDDGSVDPDNGPFGDPDGDGYPNIEEQQLGTDPRRHGGVPGHLSLDKWNMGAGSSLALLKSLPRFRVAPDTSELVPGAESPVNSGSRYGARLSGYLIAPVSGEYHFWEAADDYGELWLSTDSSKFNKQRIAHHEGWTAHRQWDKFPTQKSAAVTLVAGRKYYIEALVKEWGGGDHLSIAWQPPGGQREIIPASALESRALDPEDIDDDGLKDSWEHTNGLDPSSAEGDHGALGDPDGDLAPNWLEQSAGTDPSAADNTVPGALVYEQWDGVPGRFVADLKKSAKFLQAPDARYAVVTGAGPFDNRKNLGNRVRGYLTAPTTGEYTFWAEGNKEVELWLSSDADKFNKELLIRTVHFTAPYDYDFDISQKSKPIHLVAGQKYYLECYHKINDKTGNHFTLAWTPPGDVRRQLDPSVLGTFHRQANDLDDDDLRDHYERANGLDPSDNGALNPANGAYGDLDGDGLLNYQEQEHGTAANLADTDGDGVSDLDEIQLLETQALVGDVAPFLPIQTINGSAFSASSGNFGLAGSSAHTTATRGWVEYTLNLPAAGIYMLDLSFGPRLGGGLSDAYQTLFTIDGQVAGRVSTTIAEAATGNARILTPWLRAGAHTVRILVDNSHTHRRVNLHTLTVLNSQGKDNNGNGTPDWVENRLAALNGIDTGTLQSQVSPASFEGRARYLSMAHAPGLTLHPAPGGRWHTDIDLDAGGLPVTQTFSFENSGLTIDRKITWTITNLLTQQNITLRKGDALRLTAFNGSGQKGSAAENLVITVEGRTLSSTADKPIVYTFNTPGQHTVSVVHQLGGVQTTRGVTVTVTEPVPAIESPVCVAGFWREWDIPLLPAGTSLEIDERLQIRETIDLGAAGTRYIIKSETSDDLHALIRQNETRTILGSLTLRGMRVRDNEQTSVRFIRDYGDGSYLVEMPVVIDGLHPDITLSYDIFTGGVIFEDGTISKNITLPTDCDAAGISLLRFIKIGTSGSVCHRASVWQNGKRIAWFY